MSNLIIRKQKSDCDVILANTENVFKDLGNCFDTALDERKTKMNVVGSIFGVLGSLTKLTFNVTSCAIKNAPKAVVAVAAAKRELVGVIEEEYMDYKKQQKEDALNEKIKQLSQKRIS
ncbi:hypothetical protein JHD49_09275 [Sulfurimonas sp. SAG-AH-194-C21]|nr:hypothetical protein [Sulfurimonas sp. SAG-AH-194-C21]MDF1884129.1 hypothetical protein [Sulfurimonas sp. SAG-AH-194-C21]